MNSKEDWALLLKSKVIRGRRVISHHIFSSIWRSIKNEFSTIQSNCGWQIGNGNDINFWLDNWCGVSIASQLNISPHFHANLTNKVKDFIFNGQWNFPSSMLICFPQVNFITEQVTIPFEATEDKRIWQPSNNGDLSFKQAYEFKYGVGQNIKWAKDLWCPNIPPTKSLLVWRILHNKVSTDENLLSRGFQFPSWCSSCNILCESTFHLFFECSFAMHLWNFRN